MMRRFISKIFSAPHLPDRLVAFILVLILTQAGTLLMNQPLAFWKNAQYANYYLTLDFLLRRGPWFYGAGVILYLLVVLLLLKRLNLRAGFFLANLLLLFHSVAFFRAAPCGLIPVAELSNNTICGVFSYGFTGFMVLLYFGLLFVTLPERWVHRGKRLALLLVAAWVALLAYGLVRAIRPPTSAWRLLVPAHSPGNRGYAAVAYDTKRQRAVLFGGIAVWRGNETVYDSSTWEWDGQDWHEMKPAISPPGRFLSAMAYDEISGTVIMYGGKNQNGSLADLWSWDGQNWKQLCPVCNPAGRYVHAMFYDPVDEEIIIYGGYGKDKDNNDKGYGEAWTWNGTCWSMFQFSTSGPALINSPLVYDQANQRVIAYMKDADWGETWIWQGDAWSRLSLPVQPPLRSEATMVYDPVNRKSILYGGVNNGTWFNDTWIFDGAAWTELKTPLAPPHRQGASAFYDPVRRSMIIYGGDSYGLLHDTWELVLPGGNQ